MGAIRWDAWTGGAITAQVEKTLSPAAYHNRLPWFAEVVSENEARIDGGRQEVMDREIELAADAGLDYWAFLTYPAASPMSVALSQYLESEKRDRIRFCLILHNTLKVSDEAWPAERDRTAALLREPGYQTVLNGRPLVYAFAGGEFPFGRFGDLLSCIKAAGLDPYCVFMGWNPESDHRAAAKHGFDAVSAYARAGNQSRYSDLVASVEKHYWRKAADAGVPYVPLVTTGWDKRPRKDNPVSWEKGHAYHSQDVFPSRATPEEVAAHLGRAIAFVKEHPGVCAADAVIVYAWNEYDEGGWLAPTRGDDGVPDTSRLDAVARVLK